MDSHPDISWQAQFFVDPCHIFWVRRCTLEENREDTHEPTNCSCFVQLR